MRSQYDLCFVGVKSQISSEIGDERFHTAQYRTVIYRQAFLRPSFGPRVKNTLFPLDVNRAHYSVWTQ